MREFQGIESLITKGGGVYFVVDPTKNGGSYGLRLLKNPGDKIFVLIDPTKKADARLRSAVLKWRKRYNLRIMVQMQREQSVFGFPERPDDRRYMQVTLLEGTFREPLPKGPLPSFIEFTTLEVGQELFYRYEDSVDSRGSRCPHGLNSAIWRERQKGRNLQYEAAKSPGYAGYVRVWREPDKIKGQGARESLVPL